MKRPGPGSLKRPMRVRVLALGGVSAVARAVALDHYRMVMNRGSIWKAAGFGAPGKDWNRWSTPSPPLVSAEKARPMKPHDWTCEACGVESTEENEVRPAQLGFATPVVNALYRFFECNDCAEKRKGPAQPVK